MCTTILYERKTGKCMVIGEILVFITYCLHQMISAVSSTHNWKTKHCVLVMYLCFWKTETGNINHIILVCFQDLYANSGTFLKKKWNNYQKYVILKNCGKYEIGNSKWERYVYTYSSSSEAILPISEGIWPLSWFPTMELNT